jgi:hypothetical protein
MAEKLVIAMRSLMSKITTLIFVYFLCTYAELLHPSMALTNQLGKKAFCLPVSVLGTSSHSALHYSSHKKLDFLAFRSRQLLCPQL